MRSSRRISRSCATPPPASAPATSRWRTSIQVGTIGLINAIDRFDPDRGVQFPTFAMPTVIGEIKRYFRDNVRTVHVPRRLHELWVQVNARPRT
jgi:hypothetical protein